MKVRHHRALRQAAAAGELTPVVRDAILAVADHADADGRNAWPSMATIARRVHGPDAYDDAGAGARTAARWIATAVAAGWLELEHRAPTWGENGRPMGRTNVYRLTIPKPWRTELEEQADRARRRNGKGRPTAKAPQNRPGGPTPPSSSAGAQDDPHDVYGRLGARQAAEAERRAAEDGPPVDRSAALERIAELRARGTSPP